MIKPIIQKKDVGDIFGNDKSNIFKKIFVDIFGNYKNHISKKDFGDIFANYKTNIFKKEFGDFLVVIKAIFSTIFWRYFLSLRSSCQFVQIFMIIKQFAWLRKYQGFEILTTMMILFFAKSFYELTFWFSPRVFFCLFERMKNPKWEMKSNFFKIDSTNKLKSMDSKNGFDSKFINKTWKEIILQMWPSYPAHCSMNTYVFLGKSYGWGACVEPGNDASE